MVGLGSRKLAPFMTDPHYLCIVHQSILYKGHMFFSPIFFANQFYNKTKKSFDKEYISKHFGLCFSFNLSLTVSDGDFKKREEHHLLTYSQGCI